MESPRSSSVHRLRLPIAIAAAGISMVATAVGASADCGDLAAATLSGAWQLRMTVEPPTGTVPAGLPKVGTTARQTVGLSTVCSATGQCTATLAPSGGGILPLFDNSVDFIWYPSTGLTHAGSSYSGTTPTKRLRRSRHTTLPPPADLQHDVLTLTVLQAAQDATGAWRATVVSGTEVSPEGWVCAGGIGQSTGAEHLSLLAVPVGASFPPSTSLACAAPPVARAAVAAASNPDVSSFSSNLVTPAQAFGSPVHTLIGAAITLGVILFITFPSQLFNRTFEENYDEIREITLRRLGWLRRFRRDAEREAEGCSGSAPSRPSSWGAPPWAASTIAGFGFNLRSAATYVAVVLSILVGIAVGATVGAVYRRLRHHPVEARFHALPAGLAVAATCVLISRLSSFEPGYLYGVIASLAFQGTLAKNEQGHAVALSAIAGLTVAVVAWLVWVPVGQRRRRARSPLRGGAGGRPARIRLRGRAGRQRDRPAAAAVPLRRHPDGVEPGSLGGDLRDRRLRAGRGGAAAPVHLGPPGERTRWSPRCSSSCSSGGAASGCAGSSAAGSGSGARRRRRRGARARAGPPAPSPAAAAAGRSPSPRR